MAHKMNDKLSVFKLMPYYYIHVLDLNANISRIEKGPKTFIKQDNEM